MIAITVRQPWAFSIAAGLKSIENRTWGTQYRGLLAIHAGARWDNVGQRRIAELTGQVVVKTAMSAIVGVVELIGIHNSPSCLRTSRLPYLHPDGPYECSPWAVGGDGGGVVRHWELANARQLAEPVACKGRLGLWDLTPDVERAVLAQVGADA